jgi:hypothetical protein
MSYQEFQNKYMTSTNYLEYCDIVGAVPKEWRNLFQSKGDCRLKSDKKNHAYIFIYCI